MSVGSCSWAINRALYNRTWWTIAIFSHLKIYNNNSSLTWWHHLMSNQSESKVHNTSISLLSLKWRSTTSIACSLKSQRWWMETDRSCTAATLSISLHYWQIPTNSTWQPQVLRSLSSWTIVWIWMKTWLTFKRAGSRRAKRKGTNNSWTSNSSSLSSRCRLVSSILSSLKILITSG